MFMKKISGFVRYWLPVILWCSFIFCLSSQPNLRTSWGIWDLILRKIAHALIFGMLAWLFWRGLVQKSKLQSRKDQNREWKIKLTLAVVFSVLYAFSDEFHQSFVLGRSGSIIDVGIDSMGILVFGWRMIKIKIKNRNENIKY